MVAGDDVHCGSKQAWLTRALFAAGRRRGTSIGVFLHRDGERQNRGGIRGWNGGWVWRYS